MPLRRSLAAGGWPSLLFPAAVLLAFSLPFAAIQPIVSTGWLQLTDDKLVLAVLVVAWLLQGPRALPEPREWRALLPTLVFVLVALLSARLGGADYASDALHYVARFVAAAFVFLVVARLHSERGVPLLWAVAIGAGISAVVGVGEALHLPPFDPVLAWFKIAPTRVGGELRVSGSFEYATIASMYFEMVVPIAIALAATARRRATRVLGAAIAVVCTANVVLSLTRAGMLTLAVLLFVLVLAALTRKVWRSFLVPTLAAGAVLVGGTALLLLHDPVFDLRLVTESDANWYGAEYSAPATLSVQPAQTSTVDVDVRNAGQITWTAAGNHPFALGYRWLTADGSGVVDAPPAEVPLTHDVAPGDTIHLQAVVAVPNLPSGTYRLDWGMLQRDVLEFYERGWATAETEVQVTATSPITTAPTITPRDDGEAPWVVGRLTLWQVALNLFAQHPLTGVGPDNFRHYYGGELGLEAWDERVQANNLYLELLADLGVLGLAAFVWVIAGPIRNTIGSIRRTYSPMGVGIMLAIAAFLIHGTLDVFLAFTPTLFLLWMLLALAQKPQVSGR